MPLDDDALALAAAAFLDVLVRVLRARAAAVRAQHLLAHFVRLLAAVVNVLERHAQRQLDVLAAALVVAAAALAAARLAPPRAGRGNYPPPPPSTADCRTLVKVLGKC